MHVGAGTAQTQTMIGRRALRRGESSRVAFLYRRATHSSRWGSSPGRLPLVRISGVSRDWTLPICDERILCRMHCRGSMASARRTGVIERDRPGSPASCRSLRHRAQSPLSLSLRPPRWPRLHFSNGPEALTAREQVGIISDVLRRGYRLRRRHTRAVRTGTASNRVPRYRSPKP